MGRNVFEPRSPGYIEICDCAGLVRTAETLFRFSQRRQSSDATIDAASIARRHTTGYHARAWAWAWVLAFIGVKMLLAHTAWRIDTLSALLVVRRVENVNDAARNLGAPVTLGHQRFKLCVSDFDDRKLRRDERAV